MKGTQLPARKSRRRISTQHPCISSNDRRNGSSLKCDLHAIPLFEAAVLVREGRTVSAQPGAAGELLAPPHEYKRGVGCQALARRPIANLAQDYIGSCYLRGGSQVEGGCDGEFQSSNMCRPGSPGPGVVVCTTLPNLVCTRPQLPAGSCQAVVHCQSACRRCTPDISSPQGAPASKDARRCQPAGRRT